MKTIKNPLAAVAALIASIVAAFGQYTVLVDDSSNIIFPTNLASIPAAGLTGTVPTNTLSGQLSLLSTANGSGLTNLATSGMPGLGAMLSRETAFNYDSAAPVGMLNTNVVLERFSSNYIGFAVYVPASSKDSKIWTRYAFGNQCNGVAGLGSPRLFEARDVRLYASSNNPAYSQNLTTGLQAEAPTTILVHTNASVSGSWTGPATTAPATNYYYTATLGDYAEYALTTTNGQRIVWWTYGNTGVGHTNVQISILDGGGTPLPATNYSLVSTNVSIRTLVGWQAYELAHDLPATNWAVRITAGAGAGTSYRTYDGGMWVCNKLGLSTPGNYQSWSTYPAEYTYSRGYITAARVYQVYGTRIIWRNTKNVLGGKAIVQIFDDTGTEITSGYTFSDTAADGRRVLDLYRSSPIYQEQVLATNLTAGTYKVVIQASNEKNASATSYEIYDYGVVGFDEGTAGVAGVDYFDMQRDKASIYVGTAVSNLAMSYTGVGNLEWAPQVRLLSASVFPTTETGFVTGLHGAESSVTNFWIMTNGVAVGNYSTSALHSTWLARSVQFGNGAWMYIQDGATNNYWAYRTHTNTVTRAGYTSDFTVNVLSNVTFGLHYPVMNKANNSTLTTNGSWVGNIALGGGFDTVWSANFVRTENSGAVGASAEIADVSPAWVQVSNDGKWACIVEVLDAWNYLPDAGAVTPTTYVRSARYNGIYYTLTGQSGTRNYSAGDTIRLRSRLRYINTQ